MSSSKPSEGLPHSLAETRVAGVRIREKFLVELAATSAENKWSKNEVRDEVHKAATKAVEASHIKTKKSFTVLVDQGELAAHIDVRGHVPELMNVRDEAWMKNPALIRAARHGPSQALIDLMRLYRDPDKRNHTVDAATYLNYLKAMLARRQTTMKLPAEASLPTVPIVKQIEAHHLEIIVRVYIGNPQDGRVEHLQAVVGTDK